MNHSQLSRKEFRLITVRGTVLRVADGDTITCEVSFGLFSPNEELKIRFNGMDTPETTQHQPFAEEAATVVRDKILGKKVSILLARHKGSQSFVVGKFGRVIGVVYPGWFGRSLNEELLRRGLARLYEQPCGWMTRGLWHSLVRNWKHARRKHYGIHQHVSPIQGRLSTYLWGMIMGVMLLGGLLWWIA